MDEVIFSYTREQAIADGVLRDVSDLAKEAGFTVPVAVTAAVWAEYVAVPEACPWQDEAGRLWDILWMLKYAIKTKSTKDLIHFDLLVQNDERGAKPVTLKAVIGPGDTPAPVMTVMLVDED